MSDISETTLRDFLRDPASYPHEPSQVELIQTHISYVAVVPPYVYKIKKPVELGFLDFSSLAKRQHFCEEEVRLNRRLCPYVYEDVVPISRTSNGLVLERDSNVVEVAVKMKHLKDGFFLHQMVDREEAARAQMDNVAAKLVSFYSGQRSSAKVAEWGRIDKLRVSTQENFEQMKPFAGSLLTAPALDSIREYTNTFFRTHEPLLNRRRADGRILDCHGDLRLEHIHIMDDAVCIFDCIEFSERLRSIDTANDVAFLAMDLDFHGRPDLASVFVESFVRGMADAEILDLLDFYKCYRACVRGKVEAIRSEESEVKREEREKSRARAVRFFQLALNYATTGSRPVVMVVMGRIGSGKSTVAELLRDGLGWGIVSSDRTRKRLACDQSTHAPGQADPYGEAMTRGTYEKLIEQAVARGRKGHSIILDATFGSREYRDRLREALRSVGADYHFLELTAPESVLRERLAKRDASNAHASDARLPDFETINDRYQEPDALEDAHHREVNSARPADATAQQALRHLAAYK
jgi:aminoglycoside phosphotransferase family enzyme/predicted kinase